MQKFRVLNNNYIVQKDAHEVFTKIKDNSYYDGYWQCYSYPNYIRERLLDEITPDESFYNKFSNLISRIIDENSVAIHIRRDDYISIKVN